MLSLGLRSAHRRGRLHGVEEFDLAPAPELSRDDSSSSASCRYQFQVAPSFETPPIVEIARRLTGRGRPVQQLADVADDLGQ